MRLKKTGQREMTCLSFGCLMGSNNDEE